MKYQSISEQKLVMKKVALSRVLADLIKKHGMTTREVGRKCKIPQSTMTNLLSGRAPHKVEHLLALSQLFEVSMEYLLFGDDIRPPTLAELLTEPVFEGWLKVKIERAIPNQRKKSGGEK